MILILTNLIIRVVDEILKKTWITSFFCNFFRFVENKITIKQIDKN
jgi:hypothetical protein